MRKGIALSLAGAVAAALVAGIALLGGRVDAATAIAPSEPQVITKHRTVTVYRTETVAPETIVVSSDDDEYDDEDDDGYEEAYDETGDDQGSRTTDSSGGAMTYGSAPAPTVSASTAPIAPQPSPSPSYSDHDDSSSYGGGSSHDD